MKLNKIIASLAGGVEPEARSEVWQFLFGLYPCSSTSRYIIVLYAQANLRSAGGLVGRVLDCDVMSLSKTLYLLLNWLNP